MENKQTCEIDYRGNKIWRLNGKRHRQDGPAVEMKNGSRFWYINGKRHREDGPAAEYYHGDKEWYINGKLHRLDGPANVSHSGYKEWWINGSKLTDEIQSWAEENNIDLDNLTHEDKALIKLVWTYYGQ